jgi:uncharacterized protein (TIGR02594 family)
MNCSWNYRCNHRYDIRVTKNKQSPKRQSDPSTHTRIACATRINISRLKYEVPKNADQIRISPNAKPLPLAGRFRAPTRRAGGCQLSRGVSLGGAAEARARLPASAPIGNFDAPTIRVPAVLAEARRWLGQGNPTGKPGAWCAWFASFVLKRTGHRELQNGLASSALAYGPRVAEPKPGDLAVMRGHVTFFVGWNARDAFLGLGGNQGHRVRVSRFARRAVIAFVRV